MTDLRAAVFSWLTKDDPTARRTWFAIAIVLAAVTEALIAVPLLDETYVVQDDARQHVVWFQRFADERLFVSDPIADYFQSVAPSGFYALYEGAAGLGIDPQQFALILPWGLGLVFAGYGFLLGNRIVPAPAAAFAVSWVVTQNIWLLDHLSSATPRAFLYPIFTAFLYYAVRRSAWGVAVTIVLLGVFYPQMAIVAGGIAALAVIDVQSMRPRLNFDLDRSRVAIFGLAASFAVLAPYAMSSSVFGPVIDAETGRGLPEMWHGGRAAFFDTDLWRYWTCGNRSGMFPKEWCQLRDASIGGLPATVAPLAVLVLILIWPFRRRRRTAISPTAEIGDGIHVVFKLLVVSLGLFLAAHIVLFELHVPNRYTQHSIRIAFGIAFGLLLYRAALWSVASKPRSFATARTVATPVIIALFLGFPFVTAAVGDRGFVVGRYPDLYAFLFDTPPDTKIASLEEEAANLPAFGHRTAATASEFAIPYHLGYYRAFRERTRAVAEAQFTTQPVAFLTARRDLGADYWLLGDQSFAPDSQPPSWWRTMFPDVGRRAEQAIESSSDLVVRRYATDCTAIREGDLTLIDMACVEGHLK